MYPLVPWRGGASPGEGAASIAGNASPGGGACIHRRWGAPLEGVHPLDRVHPPEGRASGGAFRGGCIQRVHLEGCI